MKKLKVKSEDELNIDRGIIESFNLGVWHRQQEGINIVSVLDIGKKLHQHLEQHLKSLWSEAPKEILDNTTNYYTQIALLGYILAGLSMPDQEFKISLLQNLHDTYLKIQSYTGMNPEQAQ